MTVVEFAPNSTVPSILAVIVLTQNSTGIFQLENDCRVGTCLKMQFNVYLFYDVFRETANSITQLYLHQGFRT